MAKQKWQEFRVLIGTHTANDPRLEAELAAKPIDELVGILRKTGAEAQVRKDGSLVHDLKNKDDVLSLLREKGMMSKTYTREDGWFPSTEDLSQPPFNHPHMSRQKFERRHSDAPAGETREQRVVRLKRERDEKDAELREELDALPDVAAGGPDLDKMTSAQLREFARAEGIDTKGVKDVDLLKHLKAQTVAV